MKPETEAMITKMKEHVANGHALYPIYFQPVRGRSNTVSAAIRVAKSRGIIREAGLDGVGKPYYEAKPEPNTNSPWFKG